MISNSDDIITSRYLKFHYKKQVEAASRIGFLFPIYVSLWPFVNRIIQDRTAEQNAFPKVQKKQYNETNVAIFDKTRPVLSWRY